jgi:hypothetical protein
VNNLNFEKLKALVHYVCFKASEPAVLGSVKLNKVLWYADSAAYLVDGKSITGETYIKRQHGPVPRHVLRAIDALIAEGKITRGKVDHFGFMKNEFIAHRDAPTDMFSGPEVSLIDAAFEHVCLDHTAKSVSDETHGPIWKLAQMGEEIPLYTVFASSVAEVDEDDFAWAEKRAERVASHTAA